MEFTRNQGQGSFLCSSLYPKESSKIRKQMAVGHLLSGATRGCSLGSCKSGHRVANTGWK